MRIEMEKKYRTRNNKEVVLYRVDQGGPFPVHGAIRSTSGYWMGAGWTFDGRNRTDCESHVHDLVELSVIEIKSGPNLDRAIAETIGMRSDHRVPGSDIEFFIDPRAPREVARTFNPSICLNDAFYAAEAIGLFNTELDGPEVHLAKTIDGKWEILTGGKEMGYVAREATPALAICAAILKKAMAE
jgi:hypothetical protein